MGRAGRQRERARERERYARSDSKTSLVAILCGPQTRLVSSAVYADARTAAPSRGGWSNLGEIDCIELLFAGFATDLIYLLSIVLTGDTISHCRHFPISLCEIRGIDGETHARGSSAQIGGRV